ncbi:MAG: hypothetical protein V1692_01470 [bacterium]
MLDKLFGNKLRLKLVLTFLGHPEERFSVAQLVKLTRAKAGSIKREIAGLLKLNLLIEPSAEQLAEEAMDGKARKIVRPNKAYQINADFIIYPELRSLVLKGQLLLERHLVKKIEKMGNLKLLLLTGKFVGLPNLPTDIFLVGRVDRDQLARMVKKYEKELGSEINYTVMEYSEFKYRRDITDRFLYDILENKHITFVDKL